MEPKTNKSGQAIAINGLVKRHGQREILRGVSLDIASGSTMALIGPSGGGKSTLLRCLAGLEAFQAGSVTFDNKTIKAGEHHENGAWLRSCVGMIFQDYQLFPHMTVADNIAAAPQWVSGLRREEATALAMKLLDKVGLKDQARSFPSRLSGGQKQRVAIARALAMEPRVLLCDEITSALDPETKSDVLNVLEEIRAEGLTIVMVTHEIGFARRAADRVALLADGHVAECGAASDVIDRPSSERAARFLAQVMG